MLVFLFTDIEGSSKLGTELRIQQFCRRPEANRFMDWPSPMLRGGCHTCSRNAVRLGVLERPQQASTAPSSENSGGVRLQAAGNLPTGSSEPAAGVDTSAGSHKSYPTEMYVPARGRLACCSSRRVV